MGLERSLIWQPRNLYVDDPGFEIYLNKAFVSEMVNLSISNHIRDVMNKKGAEIIKKFKGHEVLPYRFHKNTGFVRQINFDSGEGCWLTLDGEYGELPDTTNENPVVYKTHNMNSYNETMGLLALFDQWVHYSHIFKLQ